jgi:hypothetical protein
MANLSKAYAEKHKNNLRLYDGGLGYEAIFNKETGEYWSSNGSGVDKSAYNKDTPSTKANFRVMKLNSGKEEVVFQ